MVGDCYGCKRAGVELFVVVIGGGSAFGASLLRCRKCVEEGASDRDRTIYRLVKEDSDATS